MHLHHRNVRVVAAVIGFSDTRHDRPGRRFFRFPVFSNGDIHAVPFDQFRHGIRSLDIDIELRKEYLKKYREEHKEQFKEYQKKYIQSRKDSYNAYQREWRAKNKDKVRQYSLTYWNKKTLSCDE